MIECLSLTRGNLRGVTRCVAIAVAVSLAATPAWGHSFPPVRTVVVQVERCEIVRKLRRRIVDMGDMSETTGVTERHKEAVVKLWDSQPGLRAVKRKGVYAMAADIFVVPGPRVTEAAEAFSQMLFGGARP